MFMLVALDASTMHTKTKVNESIHKIYIVLIAETLLQMPLNIRLWIQWRSGINKEGAYKDYIDVFSPSPAPQSRCERPKKRKIFVNNLMISLDINSSLLCLLTIFSSTSRPYHEAMHPIKQIAARATPTTIRAIARPSQTAQSFFARNARFDGYERSSRQSYRRKATLYTSA
ncbi:hypothetical protein EGR_06309 [Echinococcus granulosus]|uniref:Uncharacterized protein n=1 Tax=Echinococcus granulosus TaxID=6210 RepID=W6UCB7_ECHGR|nr:hypothetical protein EGR_06309 [Echinococcus granulosus]EUB58885.1 hypothetical protein EGR_06309 [Echinococcus granulosus]